MLVPVAPACLSCPIPTRPNTAQLDPTRPNTPQLAPNLPSFSHPPCPRAGKLGLLAAMRGGDKGGGVGWEVGILKEWRASRGPHPPPAIHTHLLPGVAPTATTTSTGRPTPLSPPLTAAPGARSPPFSMASPGAALTPAATLGVAPSPQLRVGTPARADSAAGAAGAAGAGAGGAALPGCSVARKRQRWQQQRNAALASLPPTVEDPGACAGVGVGAGIGEEGEGVEVTQSCGVSAATLQAAGRGVGLLDPLSGMLVQPGTASWQYETAGGGFVAMELKDGAVSAGDGSKPQALLSNYLQGWLSACPVTGRPWKRVRAIGPAEEPALIW